MTPCRGLVLLAATLSLAAASAEGRLKPDPLRVAAAADLAPAFRELKPQFERASGVRVSLIFGSTGLLSRQAEQGAPFDVFFAANEQYVAGLERMGRVAPGTRRLYAVGRIVVWTRAARIAGLADLIRPQFGRIAIANPDHAPYGLAAREALRRAGIWAKVGPRIVLGENVRQALQFAQTGNAGAAVVALSLVRDSGGSHYLIPASLHAPIRQSAAVLRQSSQPQAARRFLDYVLGPQGRPIMRKYGFAPPGT